MSYKVVYPEVVHLETRLHPQELSFYQRLYELALDVYAKRVTLDVIRQNRAEFDQLRQELGLTTP